MFFSRVVVLGFLFDFFYRPFSCLGCLCYRVVVLGSYGFSMFSLFFFSA